REQGRSLDDPPEHCLQIQCRTDRLANLAERPELADRASQLARARLELLEEADVLDGNDRLVGEGLQELGLPVGEQPHLAAPDRDRPEDLGPAKQRAAET